jgi:hypothetical protein
LDTGNAIDSMEIRISSLKRERGIADRSHDGSDGNVNNGEAEQLFFQRLVDRVES